MTAFLEHVEQRTTLQLDGFFPALVQGVDPRAGRFREYALLERLSRTELTLRLGRRLPEGTRLLVVVHLLRCPMKSILRPSVALRGMVVRSTPTAEGTYLLKMRFRRYRFL